MSPMGEAAQHTGQRPRSFFACVAFAMACCCIAFIRSELAADRNTGPTLYVMDEVC